MAFSYFVRPEHRVGVVRLFGRVEGSEIVQAHYALFGDPAWEPGARLLWDALAVDLLVIEPDTIEQHAKAVGALAERIGEARIAVAARREVVDQIARMMLAKASRIRQMETGVFPDTASAAAWLGVPEAALSPGAAEPDTAP